LLPFCCRRIRATVEQNAHELLAQVDALRDLSSSLAVDEPSGMNR